MKPLARCANGCARPPDPPSLVICKECQQRITRKLESLCAAPLAAEGKEKEDV